MNENIIQGKWTEFKGELQKKWADLTGDELDQTQGDLTKIGGLLEERYGIARDQVRDRLEEMLADFRRQLKEEEREQDPAAHDEREIVHGALRDQYRQF